MVNYQIAPRFKKMQYHKAALKRSCYTKYFPVIKIDMIFLQSLLFPNIMTGNSKTSKNEKKKGAYEKAKLRDAACYDILHAMIRWTKN